MFFLSFFNNLSIDWDDNLPSDKIQVEIYSLRKCSWESITERFPPNVTGIDDRDEVCLDGHDGHLHWLGKLVECRKQETKVAFDLGDETFSEICLPVDYVDRQNTLDHDWEVWVMNEYGVVESWTKHHVLSQFSFYVPPYGFTLNTSFYLNLQQATCTILIWLCMIQVNHFKFSGRLYSNVKVVEYVDSLVWIAPRGFASSRDDFG
ncbi:hypothetical protein OSB04_018053 [Centaurea solstitialis]|uniref:F-box protein n=1 Tax=Centaurea solstitialis TaxID=347529 RepID=A0AA38T425_9ASTR|nr:hypothetical protein OSB04_018053 [Centaurea solstitialis]